MSGNSDRTKNRKAQTMRQMIARAMQHPDDWVCKIVYQDKDGRRTRRVVSPVRYSNESRQSVMALCLCRQENRFFKLSGITSMEMVRANDVLMPHTIEEIE